MAYDAQQRRLLIPSGVDANLQVIDQQDADHYALAATVSTLPMAYNMAFDAQRQSVIDQSTLDKNAKPSPNDIKAALMRRYLEGGKDAPDALAALQKLFPTNDLSALFGAGAQ